MTKFKTIGLAITMSLIGLSEDILSQEGNTLDPIRGTRPIINRSIVKRDLKPDLRKWIKRPNSIKSAHTM